MQLFLNNRTKIESPRICCETMVLKNLGDISVVCSYRCFMVPHHVTCIFKAVEVWT
jgi:hypothetical protein